MLTGWWLYVLFMHFISNESSPKHIAEKIRTKHACITLQTTGIRLNCASTRGKLKIVGSVPSCYLELANCWNSNLLKERNNKSVKFIPTLKIYISTQRMQPRDVLRGVVKMKKRSQVGRRNIDYNFDVCITYYL